MLLIPESPMGFQKAYADNNWYLGKGVKAGTYYTYKIQNHDTKESQPFLMTIYFKQFDNNKGYWIAPVYVTEPNGNVVNGTFHLSDLDLSALGSSQIPPALMPYRSAYVDTLAWLASIRTKTWTITNFSFLGQASGYRRVAYCTYRSSKGDGPSRNV